MDLLQNDAVYCQGLLLNKSEEEITRIIILTILHTSWQHCHCQLATHGQDSLKRGNTVHGNDLATCWVWLIQTPLI